MNIEVHATHCCLRHGCKYGNADCPVKAGQVKQEYPCEFCADDEDTPAARRKDLIDLLWHRARFGPTGERHVWTAAAQLAQGVLIHNRDPRDSADWPYGERS